MLETILIPVDGSDSAKHAAVVGREFARRYGAGLEVVHILEGQSRLPGTGGDQDPKVQGQRILDEISDLVTDSDIVVDTHT